MLTVTLSLPEICNVFRVFHHFGNEANHLFRQSRANSEKELAPAYGELRELSKAVRHATIHCDVSYNGSLSPSFYRGVVHGKVY